MAVPLLQGRSPFRMVILLNLLLQIILTPIIVTILGSHYYGIYTLITRLQSYMALADLRPSGVLRYKLASLQNSKNINEKNEYLSTAIIVSILSIPFIILIGYLISVFFINFTKLPQEDYTIDDNYKFKRSKGKHSK